MCHFLKDYSNNNMIKFIDKYFYDDPYFEKMGLAYNDYEMGPITVNMGIMNIEKDKTRVTLDSRFPVRYDINKFNETFNKILLINHSL